MRRRRIEDDGEDLRRWRMEEDREGKAMDSSRRRCATIGPLPLAAAAVAG